MTAFPPLVGLVLALLPLAGFCLAAPCVSEQFELPFPGAAAVVIRQVDVQTAHFPGLWQQGEVGGFDYRLNADLSATLKPHQPATGWIIEMNCIGDAWSCNMQTTGSPPKPAIEIANKMERCLQGRPLVAQIRTDPVPPSKIFAKSHPVSPAVVAVVLLPTTPASATAVPAKVTLVAPAGTRPSPVATAAPLKVQVVHSQDAFISATHSTFVADPTNHGQSAQTSAVQGYSTPQVIRNSIGVTVPLTGIGRGSDVKAGNAITANPLRDVSSVVGLPLRPSDLPCAPSRLIVGSAQDGSATLPSVTCGLATLPPAAPILTLQRLLQLAAQKPGPLDGMMGARTQRALAAVLGQQSLRLTPEGAVIAVNKYLCGS